MDDLLPHTEKTLERIAVEAAFEQALNLLGCSILHPEGRHFYGRRGPHVVSSAIHFAIHCRRWLTFHSTTSDRNLVCMLTFPSDFPIVGIPNNLDEALDQIIHCKHLLASSVYAQANPTSGAKIGVALQKRLFPKQAETVVLRLETDKNSPLSIPVIVLIDSYFSLLEPAKSGADSARNPLEPTTK